MKRHLFTGIMVISLPLLFLGGLGIGVQHRRDSGSLLVATSPFFRMFVTSETEAPVPAAPDFLIGNRDRLLYYNCGNEFSAWYLENGIAVPPTELIAGPGIVSRSESSPGKFLVIPSYRTFTVEGINLPGGDIRKIPVEVFEVKNPPKPEIRVEVNNQELPEASKISSKSTIRVRIIPDRMFRMTVPQDARYKIENIVLLAHSGIGTPQKLGEIDLKGIDPVDGITISLSDFADGIPSGTRLIIQVGNIYRLNFKNKAIPLNIHGPASTFGFKLR